MLWTYDWFSELFTCCKVGKILRRSQVHCLGFLLSWFKNPWYGTCVVWSFITSKGNHFYLEVLTVKLSLFYRTFWNHMYMHVLLTEQWIYPKWILKRSLYKFVKKKVHIISEHLVDFSKKSRLRILKTLEITLKDWSTIFPRSLCHFS